MVYFQAFLKRSGLWWLPKFVPAVSKFFPFRLDPFSEGRQRILKDLLPLKCINSPYAKKKQKKKKKTEFLGIYKLSLYRHSIQRLISLYDNCYETFA